MSEEIRNFKSSLIIASSNPGKIKEFKKLLSFLPINISPQPEDLNVIETGTTFAENARIKALSVAALTDKFSLADDSGLSVEALDGAPGIYSARYADSDEERIKRLLKEIEPFENRNAIFIAALCLVSQEGKVLLEVEGKCEGFIVDKARGNNGFGYDPIFEVKSIGLTFAEMNKEQKEKFSHRGKAFKALLPGIKKIFQCSNY